MATFEKLGQQYERVLTQASVFGEHFLFFSCYREDRNDDEKSGRFVFNVLTEEIKELHIIPIENDSINYEEDLRIAYFISLDSSKSRVKNYDNFDLDRKETMNHLALFDEISGRFNDVSVGSDTIDKENIIFVHDGFAIVCLNNDDYGKEGDYEMDFVDLHFLDHPLSKSLFCHQTFHYGAYYGGEQTMCHQFFVIDPSDFTLLERVQLNSDTVGFDVIMYPFRNDWIVLKVNIIDLFHANKEY